MRIRLSIVRVALVLSCGAAGIAPQSSVYAYDLPPGKVGMHKPLEVDQGAAWFKEWRNKVEGRVVVQPYPGDEGFTFAHCGISYTVCKYGKKSWDYIREMQLRGDIEQALLDLENARKEVQVDELFIERLEARLADLQEQLSIVLEGRPRPAEGDPCLKEYRQCMKDSEGLGELG